MGRVSLRVVATSLVVAVSKPVHRPQQFPTSTLPFAQPLVLTQNTAADMRYSGPSRWEELNLMLKYIEDDEDVDIELRLSMLKLVIIDLEEARSPSGYAAYPPTLLIRAVNTNKIVKELFLSDDTPNEWKQMYICTMRAERILVTQGIHLFSGK
ncbi:hypothetical protein IWX47DRAFT_848725 [Phyllosticta citricarpa]